MDKMKFELVLLHGCFNEKNNFFPFKTMHFFFKQKTAYEILSGLVGSEMCIRDRCLIHCLTSIKTQTINNQHADATPGNHRQGIVM